jgi:hypothetical protein
VARHFILASYFKYLFFLYFVLFSAGPVFADEVQDIPKPRFLSIFTNIPDDLVIWSKDLFKKESIPVWLGVGASTGLLMQTDYETWRGVRASVDKDKGYAYFINDTEKISSFYFQVGTSVFFLTGGLALGHNRALRTSYQIGEAVLSSGIVVQILKRSTGRESPKASLERTGKWRPFPNEKKYKAHIRDYDAMPSGHLSSAYTAFVVIQENYPEKKWIPYVGYPVMGLFALSLVGTSIHWWSDFPIAFALGYHFAHIVTDRNHPPGLTDWTHPEISPLINDDGDMMLGLNWRW